MTDDTGPSWVERGADWASQGEIFDRILAPAADAIIERAAVRGRVLDVGCGTGALLEATVAAGASATGIDISPGMIEVAARRVPQAATVVADAQTADLTDVAGPGFDRFVSRFGVMFFDDPVAAFANLRRFAAPAAGMTFVCWRSGRRNAMFTLGTRTLESALAAPPTRPAPGAPGPLAFDDADRLRGILSDAGWSGVGIEPFEFTSVYATPAVDGGRTDGVDERLAVILATSTGAEVEQQVRARSGAAGWTDLLGRIRDDIRGSMVDGVVAHPNYCWMVTARAR
ncbi:MAG: class I SAM-dependent methyltransferase [Gordonia sp. (in: high G+C Gram-positive bacteria)]|uniref:class I SAM-dependent methyltransferase n=1 Tax=Gordonia sp. (in: high G+C Gram-positive bacteria) TaxID=84139 RepID=UPI003C752B68